MEVILVLAYFWPKFGATSSTTLGKVSRFKFAPSLEQTLTCAEIYAKFIPKLFHFYAGYFNMMLYFYSQIDLNSYTNTNDTRSNDSQVNYSAKYRNSHNNNNFNSDYSTTANNNSNSNNNNSNNKTSKGFEKTRKHVAGRPDRASRRREEYLRGG